MSIAITELMKACKPGVGMPCGLAMVWPVLDTDKFCWTRDFISCSSQTERRLCRMSMPVIRLLSFICWLSHRVFVSHSLT